MDEELSPISRWLGPRPSLLQIVNLIELALGFVLTQTIYRLFLGAVGPHTICLGVRFLGYGPGIRIGRRVIIRWNTRIEAIARYAGRDFHPELTIGDGTNIEQNVHIVCAERVCIGSNVTVTAGCAIVDVIHPYDSGEEKIGHALLQTSAIEIGDGSMIGVNTVILPGARIGRRVMIGANSVVSGILPDRTVWAGAPARLIRKY